MPRNRHDPEKALAALARAFAHDHALSFPHRLTAMGEEQIARYAETQGATQAKQMRKALKRLKPAERQAIADDLLADDLLDFEAA
ncbi:hypothetical protein [Planktothrix phage Pra-JY27]|nr:hypothetical protein [Planktothrix phage Pag-Yong1]WEV89218.1 hypothetical protein [Synechococcus phage MinM2]